MKTWIYRHSVLAVLLPFLPCVILLGWLCYDRRLPLPIGFIVAFFLFALFLMPVRRVFPALMAEAAEALQVKCDPVTFLAKMEVLRSRRHLPLAWRILVESNYALGLDASGRSEEACACLRALRSKREQVSPSLRYQLDMTYACVCVHVEEGRKEVPALMAILEHGYATLPFAPATRQMIRQNIDSMQDALRYYSGSYEGLRDRFVARIEAYCDHPRMRYKVISSCTWLARVYEHTGRPVDAMIMYRYVVANGNLLGVVAEAKEALSRLMPTHPPAN